ncbi:MAG: hypothetical protein FD153_77, partial [Rhodospirillaceae bacterium]
KKGKYIYYHCTGHADGNRGSISSISTRHTAWLGDLDSNQD